MDPEAVAQFTCVVDADYSQFYVRISDGDDLGIDPGETSLAHYVETDALLMVSARQWGELPFDGRVLLSRPAPLDSGWRDVVEISLLATNEVWLSGWDPADEATPLPLESGTTYRLRFAISNMDLAELGEEVTERYRIDLWPEAFSPAAMVHQASEAGRYWRIARGLDRIRQDILDCGNISTETARITEFADRAYAAYPDLLSNVLNDAANVRRTLASTAFGLNAPRAGAEYQAWYAAWIDRISDLLVERALTYSTRGQPLHGDTT